MSKKTGLGSGLEQLFKLNEVEENHSSDEKVLDVLISDLRPNPYQPRKVFTNEALNELKLSIKENGILQPIIIRKSSVKGYEIVAGERRYRASKALGLKSIPAVLKSFDDKQMMELALLENLQREDLSAIEEAEAYRSIMKKLSYTQEEMADKMGKSRSHVANLLRLLVLPESVQSMLAEGKLETGHAKVLMGVKDADKIISLAKKAAKEDMTVRQLEVLVKQSKGSEGNKSTKKADTSEVEQLFIKESTQKLRDKFGTKVSIDYKSGKGKVELEFSSQDDFERLLELLRK